MLSLAQLTRLAHALRDQRVLTVYVDGSASDPAVQRSWHVQIDNALKDLRGWLADSPHDEREAFEDCVRMLETELTEFDPGVGAPGAVSFLSPGQTPETHTLPVPTPTLAVWSTGPCLSPYLRALKQTRSVVVAVSDARKTRIFKYRVGQLEHVADVRSHHAVPGTSHMGNAPRVGFHAGTRGRTGRDEAQRALLTGRDRMIGSAVQRLTELADGDGWIVLGGIHRVSARIAERLAFAMPNRVAVLDSLDIHSTEAEISEAAAGAASALRDASDGRRLTQICDASGAHGLGVLGFDEARQALDQVCVRDVLLTRRFIERHAAEAERIIRDAVAQDAVIEEVARGVAARLDELGGIAAGLRFRPALVDVPIMV